MTTPPYFGQQHKLRNLLATCPAFQTEVGITSGTDAEKKAAAKLKIHRFEAIEKYHSGTRAIIRFSGHRVKDSGIGSWKDSSRMFLTIDLERDLPDETATGLASAEDEVLNKFGTIIKELTDRQSQGVDETIDGVDRSHLRITEFELIEYDMVNVSELALNDPSDDADPDVSEQKILWYMRWEVRTQ